MIRLLQAAALLGFLVSMDWIPALVFAPFVAYHIIRNAEEGFNVFDVMSVHRDNVRERKITYYLVKVGVYALVGVLLIYRLASDHMGVLLSGPVKYMLTSLVGADKFKPPERVPAVI
jgi:hypothetical protein